MFRGAVESTFAKSIGYTHEHGGILEIETHPSRNQPGHIYRYKNVPPQRYAGLVTAHSIGAYYNRFIKGNTRYECVEVWENHLDAITVDVELSDHQANKMANKILSNLLRKLTIGFNPEA